MQSRTNDNFLIGDLVRMPLCHTHVFYTSQALHAYRIIERRASFALKDGVKRRKDLKKHGTELKHGLCSRVSEDI